MGEGEQRNGEWAWGLGGVVGPEDTGYKRAALGR